MGTQPNTKLIVAALSCIAFLAAGCGSQPHSQDRRFHLEGKVISIDKSQQHLVIDGKDVPGFMGAMAMPYPVADPGVLDRVAPGDEITADIVTGAGGIRLENVIVVKKSDGKSAPVSQLQPANPDAPLPDISLVNQDGKQIDLRRFAGKAVLLTFIYTRCPLPDYCPLMSHNFAEIEKALAKNPKLYAKTHLLSISFDSKYDTPPVLRKYGEQYAPDKGARTFAHWDFATVPAGEMIEVTQYFNVFVTQEQGRITHSMSTAIISPDGKLDKWYSGNEWKPADVYADLANAVPGLPGGESPDQLRASFNP